MLAINVSIPNLTVARLEQFRFCVRKSAKIGVFRPSNLLGAHVNTSVGDKLFPDMLRRVAKFRKNRPSDVEKSVD